MSERIQRIQNVTESQLHCKAKHVGTAPVHEVFEGKTVWKGVVEVFDLTGHHKANRAYGWEIPGPPRDWVTVLEIPPVTSPVTAVRVYVASLGQ